MSIFLSVPLVGWIQMLAGAAVVLFVLVKYLLRPKEKKADGFLLRDVHVIVGDGTELFHQNVLIKKGMIQKVSGNPIEDKTATVTSGKGMSLMPGLIDCHVHIQGLNNHNDADSDRFLYGKMPEIFRDRLLPYGVTTIKDLGSPRHFIYKLRDEIRKGKITGPELLVVGPDFTAVDGHPANTLGGDNPWIRKEMAIEVETPEQIREGIQELKAAGVDFLKFTYQGGDYWYFNQKLQIKKLDKSLMQQIIHEGNENGLKSTAHVYYKEDVRELLEAGIYGIEHGILDEALSPDDDIIKLWKKKDTYYVPTTNAMTYEKDPTRLTNNMHNLKLLYDAGIHIAMGTDNMLEMMGGEVDHRELMYYVEAGLTPMQAIVLATKNAAEHLGIADRKGLVREGMEADLLLLEKNPAEDITNISFIDKVFLKGKLVYSQKVISSYNIPEYSYPKEFSCMKYEKADDTTVRTVDVSRYVQDSEITHVVTMKDTIFSEETYVVEKNLSCKSWHYTRPSDHTELNAQKDGEYIRLSGTFRGKQMEKSFKIGDGLWYQMMDMAMPAFIASEEKRIVFYSIGTGNNRGAMSLGEFCAEKAGEETIEVSGKKYDCIKITFVLTAFSWAWTGLYWYDKSTGQLVKSGEKGKNAAKSGYQILESQ